MLFKDIIGQESIKKHLIQTVAKGRIPHAQLFVDPSGSGALPMAIAYAQYILCNNINGENNSGNPSCNLKFEKLAHPDLHFAFPVAANDKVKKNPVSNLFMSEWREFILKNPYGSLFNWYHVINVVISSKVIKQKKLPSKRWGKLQVSDSIDFDPDPAVEMYIAEHRLYGH